MKSRNTRLGVKVNSAPLLLSGGFLEQCGYCKTAEASVVHTYPTIHLHLGASISPTQCGFKRTGALKSVLGSSFRHDVSRRESERERGGQH